MAVGIRPSEYQCVCATLRKATRSVTQIFDNMLRPSGLRATQFHMLYEIKAAGEATVTELTKRLVLDQTTLTRRLAVLERDGLLKSVPKADGRVKSVALTKKGQQALIAAQPLWADAQNKMLGIIGAAAWQALSMQLERLAHDPAV